MHEYMYTYTYLHDGWVKKAVDVSQHIDDALNEILNTPDKRGKIKKELKKSIHEARKLIFIFKRSC